MIPIDWYLEDAHGILHKAHFVRCINPDDVQGMSWDKNVSWLNELKYANQHGLEVHKLVDTFGMIHGGISMIDKGDHVYVEFIESASHNRTPTRQFVNVARLIIAFAGKRSVDIGAGGFVALEPKGGLEEYYKSRFKAYPLPPTNIKMGIAGAVTKNLIGVYYK